MKRTWIHVVLYLGCVALLLLQGRRIQQLQQIVVEDHAREQKENDDARYAFGDLQINLDDCVRELKSIALTAKPKKVK
jgi:hypothetical protein